jgi:hypothetical protein
LRGATWLVVWSQEPSWQRPYRYQSWQQDLAELDLTFDEEHVAPWAGWAWIQGAPLNRSWNRAGSAGARPGGARFDWAQTSSDGFLT